MKFTLIPTVNHRYKITKTIFRDKLLGIEIYSFKKEPKNKTKIPNKNINLTKEKILILLIFINFSINYIFNFTTFIK